MSTVTKNIPANPADLLQRISSEFPELSWQSYEHITIGWDHDVIILDDKVVFRFPNDDEYTASLSTEIEVLRQLRPLIAINIPNYTYLAKDRSFVGYPIIPGKFLSRELLDNPAKPRRSDVATQLAKALTSLHTLMQNTSAFALVPDSYVYKDQKEIKRQADAYLTRVLSDDEQATVGTILKEVDALLKRLLPVVLIHGDIYSQHLLWDESTKRLGLIDFSDTTRADPAIDFAELYEYGDAFVREVYDNYKGPKDATFLNRAWTYQSWVGIYMMTDHFVYHKTSFEVARETFDRVRLGRR